MAGSIKNFKGQACCLNACSSLSVLVTTKYNQDIACSASAGHVTNSGSRFVAIDSSWGVPSWPCTIHNHSKCQQYSGSKVMFARMFPNRGFGWQEEALADINMWVSAIFMPKWTSKGGKSLYSGTTKCWMLPEIIYGASWPESNGCSRHDEAEKQQEKTINKQIWIDTVAIITTVKTLPTSLKYKLKNMKSMEQKHTTTALMGTTSCTMRSLKTNQ